MYIYIYITMLKGRKLSASSNRLTTTLFLKSRNQIVLYIPRGKKKVKHGTKLLGVVIESHKVNFLHWILIELVSNYIVDSIPSLVVGKCSINFALHVDFFRLGRGWPSSIDR